MTSLRMAFHGVTGRRIVEVYDDTGILVGAICPSDDRTNTIQVFSDHIAALGEIHGPPRGLTVRFDKKFPAA